MGLSYYNFTPKEKEEIIEMDFTYENWGKKAFNLINNLLKELKKNALILYDFNLMISIFNFVFHIQITSEK